MSESSRVRGEALIIPGCSHHLGDRFGSHRRLGILPLRRLEPDLGRIRDSVRWIGSRFRDPIQSTVPGAAARIA